MMLSKASFFMGRKVSLELIRRQARYIQPNIQARSYNCCCSGKEVRISYCE
jgi:hypothetical protein